MSTVLKFPAVSVGLELKQARTKFRLTLTQAVSALLAEANIEVAPNTLETWENGRNPGVDVAVAAAAYEKFALDSEVCRHAGKNLMYGSIPVSTARDILDLSIPQLAHILGYSPSFWIKIEANSRFIAEDKLAILEAMVQMRFMQVCNGQTGQSGG